MENKKHTQGPWHPVQYAYFWNLQTDPLYGGKNLLDASEYPEDEAEANAKLCAAAPEMLDALQNVMEKIAPIIHKMGVKKAFSELLVIQEVNKAIRKATE